MSLTPWKRLHSEVVYQNPWWSYKKDKLIAPNGEEHEYHYMSDLGGVVIVAQNSEGTIPMIRQFRPIFNKVTVEFPAGGIEKDDEPESAARRELAEETGWAAKTIDHVQTVVVTPGRADSLEHVFVATDLFEKPTEPDPTEEFEVIWKTPDEIDQMIKTGEINDCWTLTAWMLASPRISR